MLKTKDKRLVCLIILGVSIVSLITVFVSGTVNAVINLCGDLSEIYILGYIFSLLQIVLGVSFALVFFLNKKRISLINLILLGANVLLFIVFTAVLVAEFYYYSEYITVGLTIVISAAFMTVTKLLIGKYDSEKSKTPDTETTDNSAK